MNQILSNAADSIYSGRMKWFLDATRLTTVVRPIYNTIEQRVHPTRVAVTVEDQSVTFITETYPEFSRINRLSEKPVIQDLLNNIGPDDVFFDIGANVGLYALFAARKSPNIYAFEPVQENTQRLLQNLEYNNLNANIYPVALSDVSGPETLNLSRSHNELLGHGGHLLSSVASDPDSAQRSGEASANTIQAETEEDVTTNLPILVRKGDTMIEQGEIPCPTILKIDVDGSEHIVLDGLSHTLRRHECRLVYVEVHKNILAESGQDWRYIEEKLSQSGFDCSTMEIPGRSECSGTFMLKAEK